MMKAPSIDENSLTVSFSRGVQNISFLFGISLKGIDDHGVRELENVLMPSEDENGSDRLSPLLSLYRNL